VLEGAEFKLKEVQQQWVDKTYKTLHPDDRRRLDNSLIHATIVKQDEPSEDQSSIYLIFERLNSGGTILQPQEIRVALYHGPFASLLSELNDNSDWRTLYGRKSSRLKDIELILRFLALYFHLGSYDRPMKGFLNRYMAANRDLAKHGGDVIRPLFANAVGVVRKGIGTKAFRPFGVAINAAVLDSVMYGVASRLSTGQVQDERGLKAAYDALLANEKYRAAVSKATADKESVLARFVEAKAAFQNVR
jgi:hypothetical protein